MLFDRLRLMAARARLHRLFSLISGESKHHQATDFVVFTSNNTWMESVYAPSRNRVPTPSAASGGWSVNCCISPAASAEETNRNHPPPGPFGRSGQEYAGASRRPLPPPAHTRDARIEEGIVEVEPEGSHREAARSRDHDREV